MAGLRFATELSRIPADGESEAAAQFIDRVVALAAETQAIETEERQMNERLFDLYDLTADERLLVESGRN